MLQQFRAYAASFSAFAGAAGFVALALVLAGALLEGVGILLIVPLLELFSGVEPSSYSRFVAGVFEQLGLESKQAQLLFGLAVFIALLALRNLIGWQRDIRIMQLSFGFVDQWRSRLFTAVAQAGWSQVLELQRSDIEHAITNDVGRLAQGTQQILRGSVNLLLLASQIIVALVISPLLTLLVLVFIIAAALVFLPMIKRARRLGEFVTRTGRGVHALLGHFLSGLKLAKAHRTENRYTAQFDNEVTGLRKQLVGFAADQAALRALFQFASGVVACATVLLGVFVLQTPTAILVVVLFILVRVSGPFLSLLQSLQSFANMLPAFESLSRTEAGLRAPQPGRTVVSGSSGPAQPGPIAIHLKDVCFSHAGEDKAVLTDISMDVAGGEFAALVGRSGAGKTTLADIVIGLLQPQAGTVLLNNDLPPSAAVAYVPQDAVLFDLSLRENLLWPDQHKGDAEINEALKLAGAEEFTTALKHGLDTRCGERGQVFSGGERQRLCLARALLAAPGLLILDEATNALDLELEAKVLEGLKQANSKMTILMITHRIANVKYADKVFQLGDGRLEETSPPSA